MKQSYSPVPTTMPQAPPAYPVGPSILSTAVALYAYTPTDAGDLALQQHDRIQVVEHMNNDCKYSSRLKFDDKTDPVQGGKVVTNGPASKAYSHGHMSTSWRKNSPRYPCLTLHSTAICLSCSHRHNKNSGSRANWKNTVKSSGRRWVTPPSSARVLHWVAISSMAFSNRNNVRKPGRQDVAPTLTSSMYILSHVGYD